MPELAKDVMIVEGSNSSGARFGWHTESRLTADELRAEKVREDDVKMS